MKPKPKTPGYVSKTAPDGSTGRPTKCTPEVTVSICDALQTGCYLPQACAAAGISYKIVKEWRARGRRGEQPFADFGAAIMQAEKKREMEYARQITEAGATDWRAASWMLTHRYSKRWVDRQKVEADVRNEGELRVINIPEKKKAE